jgi:hypothetical protein
LRQCKHTTGSQDATNYETAPTGHVLIKVTQTR